MATDIKDAALLNDIVKATQAVLTFTLDRTEDDYNADLMLRSAVERQVEIIGEAARNVSVAFRDLHPEIPWRKITSTRHILAHDYGMIKNDIIWNVARVPQLLELVRPLVPPPPEDL